MCGKCGKIRVNMKSWVTWDQGQGLESNHGVVILNNLNLILTLLKNHNIKLKRHKCCYKIFSQNSDPETDSFLQSKDSSILSSSRPYFGPRSPSNWPWSMVTPDLVLQTVQSTRSVGCLTIFGPNSIQPRTNEDPKFCELGQFWTTDCTRNGLSTVRIRFKLGIIPILGYDYVELLWRKAP